MEDLQEFNPEGMANRILGMGDVVELAKRVQELYDEKEARKLEEKIMKNKFDFEDFMNQIQQIKKMGNLKDLIGMIPGIGKAMKDVEISDDAFKGIEAIINSMTIAERRDPSLLKNPSRRQRIARGSGASLQEVNRLIKQFEQSRDMMRKATSAAKNPAKLMNAMRQARAAGKGMR